MNTSNKQIRVNNMKTTIYHGTNKPLIAIGKNQSNLLQFAYSYQNWHTHALDKSTLKAIAGLKARNTIITNEFGQFKINLV